MLRMGPMRPRFLLLTPACVLAGLGAGIWRTGSASLLDCALAVAGGVMAHASVNALNEHHDFRTGLDLRTRRTPFSGGTGTLPAHPDLASWTGWAGVGTALLTALIGAYFVWARGPLMLLPGLVGLALIVAYTPRMTRNPWLCLIAPGLGFGPCMVLGAEYAVSGSFSWAGFMASLGPFFFVSDLLLLNQFPDREADRSIGRDHWIIRHGTKGGAAVYGLFLAGGYASIVAGAAAGLTPVWTLLGLLTLPLAILAGRSAWRFHDDIPRLLPGMTLNVLVSILTPALVGIGFLVSWRGGR